MPNKNVPDANDIDAMLTLERELADETLVLTPEQRRGKEVVLQHMRYAFDLQAVAADSLARQFDPDYKPNPNLMWGISAKERARRDEIRSRIVNWSQLPPR